MNITSIIPLLTPIFVSQLNVHRVAYWKSLICESGHPNFVFFESNLSNPMETTLNQYLEQQSEPQTIITNIYRYFVKVPFDSCPVLFLETDSTLRMLRQATKHRKIVVCSAATYHHFSPLFIKYGIFDTIFLVFDQSQLTARYYNQFLRTQNHWTSLKRNPLNEAGRDLAGAAFIIEIHNELESVFAEFVVAEMNGTLQRQASPDQKNTPELVYVQLLTVFGIPHRLLFMHRMFEYRYLVPRLDDPKAIVSVLVDPFDGATWTLYGSMILMLALIRMFSSRRLHLGQYLGSLQDVIACSALGLSIDFRHPLEQLVLGLSKLLNILLVSAYGSLVISFVLNPRFYPALDTLDLLNESCCWAKTTEIQSKNFRLIGNCLSPSGRDPYLPTTRDHGRLECFMIHPYVTSLDPSIAAENYRWSKVSFQRYPVMAVTFGGIGIARLIEYYAGLFFAEAALYKAFHSQSTQLEAGEDHKLNRVIALADLMLLWVVYCCGMGISAVVFVLENWNSGCRRSDELQRQN